jgi:hypothetical protein
MANVLGREKREQILALGRLGWTLRRGSRSYNPIRVHEPEKKRSRLDQPRGQAQLHDLLHSGDTWTVKES